MKKVFPLSLFTPRREEDGIASETGTSVWDTLKESVYFFWSEMEDCKKTKTKLNLFLLRILQLTKSLITSYSIYFTIQGHHLLGLFPLMLRLSFNK